MSYNTLLRGESFILSNFAYKISVMVLVKRKWQIELNTQYSLNSLKPIKNFKNGFNNE